MKAAKTQKKLKEMPYPPQKKGNSITPTMTIAPISQTCSERRKVTKEKLLFMRLIF